jgi:hypothetical protein
MLIVLVGKKTFSAADVSKEISFANNCDVPVLEFI